MSLHNLDHILLKFLKKNKSLVEGQKISLACSGGVDSVSLLHSFCKFKDLFHLDLVLLHAHHGCSEKETKISDFRESSLKKVESLSQTYHLQLKVQRSSKFLKDEKSCREFRRDFFLKEDRVFLAHHKDDFLETLLLRMMRGTGPQGFVDVFSQKNFFYPFLRELSKNEILNYAQKENLSFIQDPTNLGADNLRSWLRNHWLKDLDSKRGKEGLFKSLESFYGYLESEKLKKAQKINFEEAFIDQSLWLSLDEFQKQSAVARVLHKIKKKDYTKGQINEVIKNLDRGLEVQSFKVAGVYWSKDKNRIEFQLDSKPKSSNSR